MKVHKTNKLFYKKYPYKIELSCKGAEYVKRFDHNKLAEYCTTNNSPFIFKHRNFTQNQKKHLMVFSEKVRPFLNKGYQIRVEMNTFNFYLDDKELYLEIRKELDGIITSVTEPGTEEDLEKLFSKNHIIMCNKLPHKKYGFKIMLKSNFKPEQREKLLAWMDSYGDSFRIPRKTTYWLTSDSGWCYDPFLYVESSKELMMIHLYLGDKIKRTYEYVLRDTAINTVSEDTVCQS